MPPNPEAAAQLEIGHVLFIDSVGYSKLLTDEQRELQDRLSQIVRNTEQFRIADSAGKLVRVPAGDGMALAFFNSPEAPLKCAIEISRALENSPDIRLRMGIHSGPVNFVRDVDERTNIAGTGINIAQRIMDCGDAGHILLTKRIAEDLGQIREWQPHLHDLGECSVKHGARVSAVNFYNSEVGNPEVPEKIKQSRRERMSARPRFLRPWNLTAAIALVVAAIIAFLIYQRFSTPAFQKESIAVLPFENLSDDKQNGFFADGIQDDILTALAQIGGLRVISRSSVMQFRNPATHTVREVGKILEVANVLEGSVRREGDRIVVNVQLISTLTDAHLWANRYERTLADSIGLQGELASQIANELRVTLSPNEKTNVETKPTDNSDAYVVYLQANQIERGPDALLEDYKKAERLYVKAVTLDPKFARAHARLASTRAEIFHYYEPLDSWKARARSSAETALQLQPSLGEAHLAIGQCIYWFEQDYEAALVEFDAALRLAPNNTEIGGLIAAIKRREGKWDEALEGYRNLSRLDPQNPNITRNLLFTCTSMRRWPDAAHEADRMVAMAPDSIVAKTQKGYVDFWWKGDTNSLKSILAQIPAETDPDGAVTTCRWDLAMIMRDFATASRVVDASPLDELSYLNAGTTPKSFLQGCVYLAQGNPVAAQKLFESARQSFEAAVKESPKSAERHANFGLVNAFMGRKEEAIREARHAVELKPESKDALDGALMSSYLALVYVRVGEKDLALRLIERLLKTSGAVDSANYSITVNDLKYRWDWDPIRDDPRFQKLIEQAPQ
jgi:TolB-like protein/Flp pilus assembly protein TadD